MRILHITPVYAPAYVYGGPSRSIPLLCRALAALDGVEVTVYTTDANGAERLPVPNDRPVIRDGVTVWYHRKDLKGSFHYSRQLGKASRQHSQQFDLLHSSGVWNYGMVAAAAAAKNSGVPHIVSPRNAITRWAYDFKPVRKRLYMQLGERRRLNRADALHYTTALELADSAHLGLTPESYVVPNPVDIEPFSTLPGRGYLRQQLNLPEEAFLVGMVGRIHLKKGIDLAVEALAQLVPANPRLHLVLIGPDEGGYLAEIKRLARLKNVQGHLHWSGQLRDTALVAAYTDLDCLLLPSRSESFGNVVVEAMAAGLPVLVSEQVGVAPDVAKAAAGAVFPLAVEPIAGAIRSAFSQPALRQAMGRNGQALVSQRYAPAAVAAAMLDVYREVAARKKKT